MSGGRLEESVMSVRKALIMEAAAMGEIQWQFLYLCHKTTSAR